MLSARTTARFKHRIQLDAGVPEGHVRQLMALSAGPVGDSMKSIEQFARPIKAKHARFGTIDLNRKTFDSFIANFNARTLGQDIYLDRAHNPDDGVAGKIVRLFMDGDRLMGEVEWTDFGKKVFSQDGFKYLSIDYHDNYVDPETQKSHGPLLFGVGLVPRPFIKNMQPSEGPGRWMLSDAGAYSYLPPDLVPPGEPMKKALEQLRNALASKKLSSAFSRILLAQLEAQINAAKLAENEEACIALATAIEQGATEMSAALPESGQIAQLSAEQIGEIVSRQLAERDTKAKQLADNAEANRKTFTDTINAATGLSDQTKTALLKAVALVGTMEAASVAQLAASQIELGNAMEASAKLGALGFNANGRMAQGSVIVSGVGSQAHGLMREKLLATGEGQLVCTEESKLSPICRKVLAAFDAEYGRELDIECKRLAGDGSVNVNDGVFPVVAQRQVIVELLADLKFLNLVNTVVDTSAQSTIQIPYEVRNLANISPGAVVYENQPIPYAGVSQLMDQAFTVPRKIAMKMSNEMIHFSRNALINWDAWARSIGSNARAMRDIIAAAIANEMLRASDSSGAVNVTNETNTAQSNGTRSTFKTAQFPVVPPRTPRDLRGMAVGTPENPITFTYNGGAITMYDGTGTQAAGNYFRFTDYGLGLYQIVNQAGVVQTPANATAQVISYSYATNVVKFDIDVPNGVDYDKHLNGLLRVIGRRKATLMNDRFVEVQYGISSVTLNNTISEAEQFDRESERPGNGLTGDGILSAVKGIPMWGTNQPGTTFGDGRLLIGEMKTTSYAISKVFATGTPFEVMDPTTMRPTGQKQAYGEEYSAIHTPIPLKNRSTSVLVYSATARAAI